MARLGRAGGTVTAKVFAAAHASVVQVSLPRVEMEKARLAFANRASEFLVGRE